MQCNFFRTFIKTNSHTMKRNTAKCPARLAPRAMGADGKVSRCTNLVNTTLGGDRALTVAPALGQISQNALVPLARRYPEGEGEGPVTLFAWRSKSDMSLWIGLPDDEPYELEHPAVKEIYCAIATAQGFIAMTSGGPLTLHRCADTGEWVCDQTGMPGLLMPELVTESAGALTAQVQPRTFSKVTVSRTDIEVPAPQLSALAADLCGAYSTIAGAAAHGGLWLQPVVARIVLRNASGGVAMNSAPTMARSALQCTDTLTCVCSRPSDDSVDVPQMVVKGNAYRLKLRISARCAEALNAASIRSAEVWVSPQCHPVDYGAEMPLRWTAISTHQPTLSVAIPGATARFASTQYTYARRVAAMLSNPGPVLARRLVLNAPFAEGDYTVDVPPFESVEADNRLAARATEAAVAALPASGAEALLRSLQAPSSFIARCGCVCGDKVLWANITPLPPSVIDLANICTFDKAHTGLWTARVFITLRNAQRLCYPVEGSGPAPSGWAPVVSSTMPDAMAIEVYVSRDDGTVVHGHSSLDVAADFSSAFMLDRDFVSRPFEVFEGELPSDSPAAAGGSYGGAVVVAPVSSAGNAERAAVCCPAAIEAIVPARRTFSAWDSAAARAYAFTRAGIYAVNGGGASASVGVSSALIDHRAVTSGAVVCASQQAIYAACGKWLLRIRGTTAESRKLGFEARSIAWCYEHDSLWIVDTAGGAHIYHPATDTLSDYTSSAPFDGVWNIGTSMWLTTASALLRPSAPAAVRILWRGNVALPCGSRVQTVCVHACGSRVKGYVRITAAHSTENQEPSGPSTTLSVDGTLASPLVARLALPSARYAMVEIDAEVSADFVLYGITLNTTGVWNLHA